MPHDVLRTCDFDDVWPVEGKINILVCHGVVGGSDLYKRTIGREYALPIDVASRGWDYVAMGHWHKRGPVAVGGYSDTTTPIWYAGSTENNGFADVAGADGSKGRGYLRVNITKGERLDIKEVDLPVRAMFRLSTLDAKNLLPEEITNALIKEISRTMLDGAVVLHPVTGVSRDAWALVEHSKVRAAAKAALWYEARPTFHTADMNSDGEEKADHDPLADLGTVLSDVAGDLLKDDPDLDQVLAMTRALLGDALSQGPNEDEDEATKPEVTQTPSEPADTKS
jgi:hypothetical protein